MYSHLALAAASMVQCMDAFIPPSLPPSLFHVTVCVSVCVCVRVYMCVSVFLCMSVHRRSPVSMVRVSACYSVCTDNTAHTFPRNILRTISTAISAATNHTVHRRVPRVWRVADKHVTMATTHSSSTYTSMPPVTPPKTKTRAVWILSREDLSWLPNARSTDAWSVRFPWR